jgi:hypothetical protein
MDLTQLAQQYSPGQHYSADSGRPGLYPHFLKSPEDYLIRDCCHILPDADGGDGDGAIVSLEKL